jgi:hypothetical protein
LLEREQANKDAELELKRQEQASSKWWNPLVVAILAAALAALGNAIVTVINGRLQRECRKCLIFQWGLTDTLSATALFSSVSDRSNRQQNNE